MKLDEEQRWRLRHPWEAATERWRWSHTRCWPAFWRRHVWSESPENAQPLVTVICLRCPMTTTRLE